MAVQILGLRSFVDSRGKERKAEKFFEKGWRASSVAELFLNLDEHLTNIPEKEHWNLYYTASVCKEEKGRIFVEQHVIPIDVDGIDVERVDEYVNLICSELGIVKEETGIVFSGNGLQFIIGITNTIEDVSFFDTERHLYKAMCGKLNQAMYGAGLEGEADVSVFSGARLLRLANTKNIKPNKPHRMAYLINAIIKNVDFDMSEKTGVPKVLEGQHVHPKAMTKMAAPDPKGVQEGCDFLKMCFNNQATIGEPQWYAMLSIIGRLPDGERLAHLYSQDHPDYDAEDTQFKFEQAIEASGPRKCENIESLWDGCKDCVNYQKCTSPIMIKSEEFIGTKDTGFYDVTINPKTGAERRVPNYDDLVKHFIEQKEYTTLELASIVHTHDGKKWADISRNKIHNFAEVNFDPSPSNTMCIEFEAKLKRTNIKPQEWYTCEGFINFQNGVLDIDSRQLLPHSIDYGFKYVLPFDYDPQADCPRFKQFLSEVCLGREDIMSVLVEFMGYSLAGVDPQLGQKALILHGEGANGKSVFIEVLRALAGTDNYSTLSMGNEVNKLENRYQLQGKLFNVSEETPNNAMVESSVFKSLVSGGEVQARKLYCDAFSMRNYAKIIMACNDLPRSSDMSHGMLRRLLIVPFNAVFDEGNRDIHIVSKLKEELSGIFNLAMEGYERFTKNNQFTYSKTIDDEVDEYIAENDTVQAFMTEMCRLQDGAQMIVSDAYSSYSFYCDNSNMKPLTKVHFSKRVKSKLQSIYKKDMSNRSTVGGARVRVYDGVSLLTENGGY